LALHAENGENMSRLFEYQQALYELRFSPMCKPAAEVANLTQLESHSVRSRVMMMWRVSAGHLQWGPREVELIYESTLDSISEAFDVFHYPISRYMLDARADIWDAGLVPQRMKEIVENAGKKVAGPPSKVVDGALCLAGEIFQLEDSRYQETLEARLNDIPIWSAPTGVLPYVLGAREVARAQAEHIVQGISDSDVKTVIVDGPETAWGLLKVYSDLGVELPKNVGVQLLSEFLLENSSIEKDAVGKAFIHDSRPACLIAEKMPGHLSVVPGCLADETVFGEGKVFDAPRQLVDNAGAERVYGTWTRCLAKSCGADDGLQLTYPRLAEGLARQQLDYAKDLGAEVIISDSPLCVDYFSRHAGDDDLSVYWLAELVGV
jgi:hypothetical protein